MKCCADLFDTEDLEVGSAGQGQDVQSVSDKWQLSFQAQLLRLPAFDLNSELLYLNLFYEEYFRKHIFVQLLANEITYFFNMEQNQEDQGESFRWSLHFSAFCTFLSFWWQLSLPLTETFKKSSNSSIFTWNQFCQILSNFSNDSWAWRKFDGEVSIVELIKQYAVWGRFLENGRILDRHWFFTFSFQPLKMMKAVQVENFGGPEVLQIKTNLIVPPLTKTQVLVRVKCAGVNPVETYIREGQYTRYIKLLLKK